MVWPREIYVATINGGVYYTANFVNPAVQPVWTAINSGLGTDLYCHEFHLDPFHEADRQFVLSNTSNAPANNSLYRRYLGATWTAILTPASLATLSGHSPCEIWGFCCDPSIDGRMWALVFITGVGDMAIYSDDWGDTWNLTTAYYNSYYNLHSVRAYGDLVYVRDCVGVGAYPYVEFSSNKGSTWGYIATDLVDWFPGAALNPLEPTKLYHSDNTPRLQYYTMGGGLTTLINGFTLDDWDTIWFDPVDVLHQRVIYNNKLYVTDDGWATKTDSGTITSNPCGISPWYGTDLGKMLLEISLNHSLGSDHVVATLDGEGSATSVPIAGNSPGTPPYTDSIPYTAGQICRCGLQAVHQGKGKIYTNAVAMYGYSDTGLDRGIPMAGDRGAWDAKNYPLRHTDDIDDNGIHWTEAELKSWNLGDFGSDSADDGYVLTADGVGGANWEAPTGGGGGGGGGTEYKMSVLTFLGDLTISDNPLRLSNELTTTQTIVEVYLTIGSAPTGDDVVVDIHKNGTTIFTNQAHRPVIAAGTNSGTTTSIDVSSWADGDYLTAHVDSIGTTLPGSNLVVHVVTTGPGGGASTLDDLTDVNVPSPGDNDVLAWDAGAGEWVNVPASAGSGGLEGIFSVKDPTYGAVGDGTTDDTTAVQATIEAAHIDGGIVYLPPGVYSCDPLTFYNNTNIFGAGMNLSTLKARSSGILLYSSYFSNGELQDFQLDGDSTGATGLKIDGTCWMAGKRLRIHDFTDKDLYLHGVLISSFYDCFFTDSAYGTYGEIGDPGQEANLVLFENCTWRDNSTRGIYWTRGDQLILISPNIEHCGTIADTSTGGIYFSGEVEGIGLNIKDGWFESNYGGENIKIDTPYYPNNTSIITDTMFVSNTSLVYGIYLNGASSLNKLICRGVNFYDDAATADYESNGSSATIYLNRCTGTTAGTGAIIDDSTSAGFTNPMTTIGDIIVETATGGSVNVALTSLGVSATANQYQAGHEPDKAIDGDDGTYWHSNHANVNDDWITIDLGSSQEIKGFRILQYPVGSNDATTCPIYSSPDNASWTLIETASLNSYPNCETIGNFPSPVTDRYFCFSPSAGGAGGWAVQTIELYAPLPGADRLGIGDENDVLTVVSGVPSWQPGGAGSGVKQTIFTFPGVLAISDNPLRIYNKLGSSQTISQVFLSVGTAPVGDSVIVDIHKNGVTIFTNQANRPEIVVSAESGFTTTIDVSAWDDGDYLTAHVDNVGSGGTEGSDLVVHVIHS